MRPTRRTFLKLTGAAAASLYTTRGFGQEGEEAATRSVIWYIDIEHQKSASQGDFAIKRGAIEEAAPGCSVNYVWYGDVVSNPSSLESMKAGNVLAWFISGNTAEWADYIKSTPSISQFEEILINNTTIPMFAVCGGHQIMSVAFGGAIAHMSGCPTDKDCEYDKTLPITVLTPSDPIFAGLPTAPEFVFWHHDEVISSPEFSLLAKTASCKYQVLKHKERLIYTTQFHPELRGPHGVELMTNFFNLCKRHSY
ncbi:MAG: gamma-glutamyl-gamma-aminobutyrate hydrolase family protein [Deltaproteobacteria bacterium]|nr:gamma-glutamyl-gamma-aminobutyrate hydrolase family protein [Deltaproteobacteria bacterium]